MSQLFTYSKSALSLRSLLLAVTLASCSPQPPPSSLKILGGTPTPQGESLNVVAVATSAGDFMCTGVLITDRLVVTAAHCLARHAPYEKNLRIATGTGNDQHHFDEAQLLPVVGGNMAPGYKGRAEYDIAYLILKDAIPNVTSHIIPPATDYAEILEIERPQQKLRLIGYGCRDQQINCKAGVKYQVDVHVNSISRLTMDVGTSDKGASNGDSGGPAFALLADGSWRLTGITSGRGAEGADYGLVRPYLCWIGQESKIEIPGAGSHCYDQTPIHPKDSVDVLAACKNPANELQAHTFTVLKKHLGTSDCDPLIKDLATVASLDLSNAYFFDSTVLNVAGQLKRLNLTGNRYTSLSPLHDFRHLEQVTLDLTKVLPDQLTALHSARPDIKIATPTAATDLFDGLELKNTTIFDLALANVTGLDIRNAAGLTPLQRAIELKQHDNTEKLIAHQVPLNATEPTYGHTALHLAVFSNSLRGVQLLVDNGADCTIRNKGGDTVLDVAELYNKGTELHKYLLAHCRN